MCIHTHLRPGGGGQLDDEAMPRKKAGYFIAGTWSRCHGAKPANKHLGTQ